MKNDHLKNDNFDEQSYVNISAAVCYSINRIHMPKKPNQNTACESINFIYSEISISKCHCITKAIDEIKKCVHLIVCFFKWLVKEKYVFDMGHSGPLNPLMDFTTIIACTK